MIGDVRSRFTLAFMLVLVSGCTSVPPQDAFYTLAVAAVPVPAAPVPDDTILVGRLAAHGLTGGRQILFRDALRPHQIQRYHYLYWSDAPPAMVHQQLVEALRRARVAQYVVTPAERVEADWIVSGTLLSMEHHPETTPPEVSVALELGMVRAEDRVPVLLKRYALVEPAQGSGIDAAISAFERALARVFDQFIEDVRRAMRCESAAGPNLCR